MVYLDYVVIFSENAEQHKQHVDNVLRKVKAAGLKLNSAICDFAKQSIEVLVKWCVRVKSHPHQAK